MMSSCFLTISRPSQCILVYLSLQKNLHASRIIITYHVYLFLTNRPRCFQNTITIETVIPDFHEMVVPVLTVFYKKQKPKIIKKTFQVTCFGKN